MYFTIFYSYQSHCLGNENVLDSNWALTSHTFRLVVASQQIRVCDARVTNV